MTRVAQCMGRGRRMRGRACGRDARWFRRDSVAGAVQTWVRGRRGGSGDCGRSVNLVRRNQAACQVWRSASGAWHACELWRMGALRKAGKAQSSAGTVALVVNYWGDCWPGARLASVHA